VVAAPPAGPGAHAADAAAGTVAGSVDPQLLGGDEAEADEDGEEQQLLHAGTLTRTR
jgi:hypothetical protein